MRLILFGAPSAGLLMAIETARHLFRLGLVSLFALRLIGLLPNRYNEFTPCLQRFAALVDPPDLIQRELAIYYRHQLSISDPGREADYIPNARHAIMPRGASDPLREFALRSNDFYTLSGCRDMLYHVSQHSFTLPKIAEILDRNRLRFLCMGSYARLQPELAKFPDFRIDQFDLMSWHEAEKRLPRLFASMYFLHLQKGA